MKDDRKKIKCLKITRPDTHGEKFYCIVRLDRFSASDEFDGADTGESVILTLCEMTEGELKELPEFGGW